MSNKSETLRLAGYMDHPLNDPNDVADAVSSELRRLSAVEAQRDALLGLLKEARKIIRASSSRNLVKDWDQRTTDAIKAVEGENHAKNL